MCSLSLMTAFLALAHVDIGSWDRRPEDVYAQPALTPPYSCHTKLGTALCPFRVLMDAWLADPDTVRRGVLAF